MIKYKRRKSIPFIKFKSIFTGRTFSIRYKILRKIFIVESVEGNYRIEEHPSILGYFSFAIFTLLAIFPVLFIGGYAGLIDMKNEWIKLIKNEPLRADDLYHDKDKTIEVLKVAGWG